jgi:hypothetical protein
MAQTNEESVMIKNEESLTRQAFRITKNVLDSVGAILVLAGTVVPLAVCIFAFLAAVLHH